MLRRYNVVSRVINGYEWGTMLASVSPTSLALLHHKRIASTKGSTEKQNSKAKVPKVAEKVTAKMLQPVDSEEGFNRILESFKERTTPFADLDEVLATDMEATYPDDSKAEANKKKKESAPDDAPSKDTVVLTHRTFSASLVCPKKFYLQQFRNDLAPKTSIGEAVFLDDAAGFNELARRWDRLQFGSKAILIQETNFHMAVQHTEEVIRHYFETAYASLGEQAPSLTLHRPAFAVPFYGKSSGGAAGGAPPIELRARPCVIRFRAKDNQWVILESMASLDPVSTPARTSQCLLRIHYSLLAFRLWITQPHIPISIRKRFLNIDLDGMNEENEKGHMLADTAQVEAPIDLKRSGILHIRNYFPGPATLMDCDPSRLVKFIQRLPLEELIEIKSRQSASNPFDLPVTLNVPLEVAGLQEQLRVLHAKNNKYGPARSSRSLKTKDAMEHNIFNIQQRALEELLTHHTASIVQVALKGENDEEWTSMSSKSPNGKAVSSTLALQQEAQQKEEAKETKKRGGKKAAKAKVDATPDLLALSTEYPLYSKFLGTHCSRHDVCPFFTEGKCLPCHEEDPLLTQDNHLFTLPSSPVSKKVVWWAEGLRTVRDLLYLHKCGKIKLSAPQLRYVKTVSEGKIAVNPSEIENFFQKIRYPCFIIDFEAAQFALPPFQRETAYQAVPFQFSLDVFQHDVLTETPQHYDFLHFGKGYSPNVDPRNGCIEELMRLVTLEREKKKAEMTASGELESILNAEEEALAAEAAASGKRRRKKKAVKVTKDSPLDGPVNPYDGCFIAHFASFEKSCLEKLGQLEDRFKEEVKHFFFLDTMEFN
ncbi:hypothetical protein AGDE_10902 [Angomonas deanei]|nr:hypothetical protein AGDE_10902 [Angomonas deanei]|eukprot:EPY27165.1 hypothetical protein AGDE_10902 [Angomonas deanei]